MGLSWEKLEQKCALSGSLQPSNCPGGTSGKEPTDLPMQETEEMRVRSLGWEDPLELGLATHSSMRAWRIPQADEPGGLQPRGS